MDSSDAPEHVGPFDGEDSDQDSLRSVDVSAMKELNRSAPPLDVASMAWEAASYSAPSTLGKYNLPITAETFEGK